MKASRPADEDRLPWLEPYRETIAQKKRVARRSHGPLVALVTALILLPVGIGIGIWWGQQSEAPNRPQSTATVALPPARPAPVKVAEAPPAAAEPVVAEAAPEPAKVTKPAPARKKAARQRTRPKKIRNAGVEAAQLNAVREAQERKAAPAPPPKPVAPSWPKMPSPGPAGQVIQLGAFTTINRASSAYQARVARYPILARMPRVIVPVATKPGNRVLYVLRLGTTSRQQSKTVCRNLRRSGDHCLVIG